MPNETCMPVSREGTQSGLVGSCIGTAGPAVAVRNVRSRAAALLFERVYNQRRRGPSNGPSPMHLTLAPGPYADARCVSSCSCLSHPGNPPCNVTLCTQNTPLDILAMLQPSRMFALRTDARQVSLHGKLTCLHGMVMSKHLRRCSRHAVCTFPEDPVGFRCSRSWAQRDTLLTLLLLFLAPLFIFSVQCGSCAAELPGRLAGPLLPRLDLHGVVQHPDPGPSRRERHQLGGDAGSLVVICATLATGCH